MPRPHPHRDARGHGKGEAVPPRVVGYDSHPHACTVRVPGATCTDASPLPTTGVEYALRQSIT